MAKKGSNNLLVILVLNGKQIEIQDKGKRQDKREKITLTLIRIKLTCRVIIVTKNWLIYDGWRLINFCTKRLSEGPYLKSSISRVFFWNH